MKQTSQEKTMEKQNKLYSPIPSQQEVDSVFVAQNTLSQTMPGVDLNYIAELTAAQPQVDQVDYSALEHIDKIVSPNVLNQLNNLFSSANFLNTIENANQATVQLFQSTYTTFVDTINSSSIDFSLDDEVELSDNINNSLNDVSEELVQVTSSIELRNNRSEVLERLNSIERQFSEFVQKKDYSNDMVTFKVVVKKLVNTLATYLVLAEFFGIEIHEKLMEKFTLLFQEIIGLLSTL